MKRNHEQDVDEEEEVRNKRRQQKYKMRAIEKSETGLKMNTVRILWE